MRRGAVLFAGLSLLALALASVADAASVSPDSMDFGSQAVGTAGSAATFTLTASANFCTNYVFPTCMSTTNYQTDTTALGGGPGTTDNLRRLRHPQRQLSLSAHEPALPRAVFRHGQ